MGLMDHILLVLAEEEVELADLEGIFDHLRVDAVAEGDNFFVEIVEILLVDVAAAVLFEFIEVYSIDLGFHDLLLLGLVEALVFGELDELIVELLREVFDNSRLLAEELDLRVNKVFGGVVFIHGGIQVLLAVEDFFFGFLFVVFLADAFELDVLFCCFEAVIEEFHRDLICDLLELDMVLFSHLMDILLYLYRFAEICFLSDGGI